MSAANRTATIVGVLAALGVSALILLVSARPLATADTWYYLKMGELYSAEGPWAQSEPMLFTHGDVKPTPHEWLSEVLYYQVQRSLGFQGLRLFHAGLVVGILALAWRLFRAAAGSGGLAGGAFAIWAVLTYPRLYQTRADLFSILSALLIYRWVLEDPRRTTRGQLAAALAVAVFWVNAHSLFLIAFALAGAAALGALLERLESPPPAQGGATAATDAAPAPRPGASGRGAIGTALLRFIGLGVLATAINPRGLLQHVTFFTSQSEHAIWDVVDDWFPFNPLVPGDNSPMLSGLGWALGTLTLVLFAAAIGMAMRATTRLPREQGRELLDLPALMMGVAGSAAYLISFRFMWLAFLPLLYTTRVFARVAPSVSAFGGAIAGAATALALPSLGFWLLLMSDVPGWAAPGSAQALEPKVYLQTAVNHRSFAGEGAAFLRDAELEGHLFNNYTLGAYLGYHLAPRLRTFIDGRTEHYSAAVAKDYDVIEGGSVRPEDGRTYLQLLEDYSVDVFFGVGGPGWPYRVANSTLRHLEGVQWWRLVYRSAGFAIYLRDNPRNDANFARVAAYWAALGVPFSRAQGLDVGAVLAKAPAWALENRLVAAAALTGEGATGLRRAARARFTAGDYTGAVETVRALLDAGGDANDALLAAEAKVALGDWGGADALMDRAAARGADPAQVQRLRELREATEQFRAHLVAPAGE